MKKRIALLLAAVLFISSFSVVMFSGCAQKEEPVKPDQTEPEQTEPARSEPEQVEPAQSEKETITIVDSAGREVEIPYPVNRIAVHYPYLLEWVTALGAEDKVVAVADSVSQGRFGKLLEVYTGRAGIGVGAGPRQRIDLEGLLEADVDVLLVSPGVSEDLGIEEMLEPYGVSLVKIDSSSVITLEKDIMVLGELLGKEKEAQEYLAFVNRYVSQVEERIQDVRDEEKPRVYLEFYSDYFACTVDFGGDPVTTRAGGINIASDLRAPTVSPEWVVEQDPDVIIKGQLPNAVPSGFGVTDPAPLEEHLQEIISRPVWDTLKAVREGRIYIINGDLWSSPRSWLGIVYTAKILYPEMFADIDPDLISREYAKTFLGFEEEGIWVWPEID